MNEHANNQGQEVLRPGEHALQPSNAQLLDLAITYHDPKSLIPNPRNARRYRNSQISKLVESIRTFGFWEPILITNDNVIVAGHGRVLAAKKLKNEYDSGGMR